MPMDTPRCTGLEPDAQVFTLSGTVPVRDLAPGARVITRSGAQTLLSLELEGGRYRLGFERAEVVLTAAGQVPAGPALAA